MKKNIYIAPEITVYKTIVETAILAGSKIDIIEEEEDVTIEDALSKPVTLPDTNLWGDENEDEW